MKLILMFDSYIQTLQDFEDFDGRSSRKEFWTYIFVHLLVILGICCIGIAFRGLGLRIAFALLVIYSGISFVPTVAVTVRRMHDIGIHGRAVFLAIVPLVGWLFLFVLCCKKGEAGVNQYGIDARIEEDEFV